VDKKYDANETMATAARPQLASAFTSDVKALETLLGRSLAEIWLEP